LCEVADSARYYDIRVSKVQPRVFGASCHSGLVELDIRASVETGIEDAMGTMLRFSHHHPRNTSFTHHVNTSPEGTLNDDLGEGMDGPLSDEYLDAVGVYGTWTLRVSPAVTKDDPNFGLALDNISGVRIYFHAFAKERPSFMARRASEIAALAED
jgi:hypothetical protein